VKKKILYVLFAILCVFDLVACSNNTDTIIPNREVLASQLQEANYNCIKLETHDIVMQTVSEGVVIITVQIPDYEGLYKKAYTSENPDQYLLNALTTGKYDVREYEITAQVTIENEKEVIRTDEAIKELLEEVLSNATDALMEVE